MSDPVTLPPDQACQDNGPPTSGALACLDVSGEQGHTTANTEQSVVADNATHVATPVPSSQSTADPPSPARASPPSVHTPLDTVDVPDMPVGASPSSYDNIPDAHDVSPAGHQSCEIPLRQDFGTSTRDSEDSNANELSEGTCQSSSEAYVLPLPPPGPTTRRRARRQATHTQKQDGNDDSSDMGGESQEGQSYLDGGNLCRDGDYYSSPAEAEEMGLQGGVSDGDDQCRRKRRKVSRSAADLPRDAASVKRPRRGRPSLRSRGKNA